MKLQKILILDGGISTYMTELGLELNGSLWGANYLLENPKPIAKVHSDYVHEGLCDICTSSSYQISQEGLAADHVSMKEEERIELASRMFRDSVQIARKVVREKEKLVAASVSCFGASISNLLGEAKEYFGDYLDEDADSNSGHYVHKFVKQLSEKLGETLEKSGMEQVIYDFHYPRVRELILAEPDFILLETMPVLKEVEILCDRVIPDILKELNKKGIKVMISFYCKDGLHTGHGESIEKCVEYVNQDRFNPSLFEIFAVGANCISPSIVPILIENIHTHLRKDISIILYPNSGEIYDNLTKSWSIPQGGLDWLYDRDFIPFIKKWSENHPERKLVIGGCCRTNPRNIKKLANSLNH